jgi:hypothetical protein
VFLYIAEIANITLVYCFVNGAWVVVSFPVVGIFSVVLIIDLWLIAAFDENFEK